MSRKHNDCSEYINKQFGELTILSISEQIKGKMLKRYCKCKCACGNITTIALSNILYNQTKSCGHLIKERMFETHSEKMKFRNEREEANESNQSTGVKNISFVPSLCLYRVDVRRNGVRYYDFASSLEEAIKIKERILQELGEM